MDHHPNGTHRVRVILAAWPTECIQNCQPRYVNANSNNNIDNNINNNSGYTVWSGHFSDTDTHSHTHIEHWHIVRPCRKKNVLRVRCIVYMELHSVASCFSDFVHLKNMFG